MPEGRPGMAAPRLALVVPCYNESETLPRTIAELDRLLAGLKAGRLVAENSFALYVDDGSRDGTWDIIEHCHSGNPLCRGVKFAGNAGHQNALVAGMQAALELGADCVITLDADLQDDISVIPEMLSLYAAGYDIVFGVRSGRETDTPFKRRSAWAFYRLMSALGINMVPDHADFRLVARPVLAALANYGEQTLFLRGLFPSMGFRQGIVRYRRLSRQAGETKYPLAKMISFAWRGITACSAAPLRLAGFMGMVCMLGALAACCGAFFQYLHGETIPGWTSLMIVVLALGAVQLFCLALMGEYIARIFTEVRARPRFIIEKKL